MTGLNLEPFLRLLGADMGVWISLGAVVVVLGLMAWTSWGSRRALRKCLVLSIAVHVGLVLYGGRLNSAGAGNAEGDDSAERIQSIRVVGEDGSPLSESPDQRTGSGRSLAAWDKPSDLANPSDTPLRDTKPEPAEPPAPARTIPDRMAAPDATAPALAAKDPAAPDSNPTPEPAPKPIAAAPARAEEIPSDEPPPAPVAADDDVPMRYRPSAPARGPTRTASVGRPVIPVPSSNNVDLTPPSGDPVAAAPADRPAPDRSDSPTDLARAPNRASDAVSDPGDDLRSRTRPGSGTGSSTGRTRPAMEPVTIARAGSRGGMGGAASPLPAPPNRPVMDIPEVYRERVDPDRSARARLQGASDASEKAVERALDWLARHQDGDGRWNAGTKKYRNDDSPARGETNFTMHCPPGEVCSGECFYYEADTAMTGLALLAYLGAGYTHTPAEGKYAPVVAKGLQFLLDTQTNDGDLRGESRAVGMYCHAMAALALCEAYALSGDERLREPAARAVAFLAKGRAADGLSWRYKPGDATGDTSLLGWAILVFKTADEVGLTTPASLRVGALGWLKLVEAGDKGGLAVYRPNEGPTGGVASYVPGRNMTPTMTAEAWVCRQFLGVGGPGSASDEAAAYLKQHQPERGKLNLYYWYYGTLAMHRRGGADWNEWNQRVRDELVALQKTSGHQSGSWDPADSRSNYDGRGGRVYCTALAAMTLEVYYRYGPTDNAKPPRMAPRTDPGVRRSVDAAKKP